MLALLFTRAGAALLLRCAPFAILTVLFIASVVAGPLDYD